MTDNPAFLFLSSSVLCAPGMDDEALEGIRSAITFAQSEFGLWLYILRTEDESAAFRRADGIVMGQHLHIRTHTPGAELQRVLREVAHRRKTGVIPSAVWLLSDVTPVKPTARDRNTTTNIEVHLGSSPFRVLHARLGNIVTEDDLLEVFLGHQRALWGM